MGNKTAMGKEVMVSFSELDWGWGEGGVPGGGVGEGNAGHEGGAG